MTKSITWILHVDKSQGNHKYYMILGGEILSELKIALCFSNNTIRLNGGTYKGYMTNINFSTLSERLH